MLQCGSHCRLPDANLFHKCHINKSGIFYQIFYKNGKMQWLSQSLLTHREDGPAIITNNSKKWYVDGNIVI